MNHSQRLRLADRYLECLDEGRIEDLGPILKAAETDAELADRIVSLSRGFSEEHGHAISGAERRAMLERLGAVVNFQ